MSKAVEKFIEELNKEHEIILGFQEYEKKIADLEAKLAEKDKAIENWQTMYESVIQTCHNDKEEIERLNKQLAEKEKEIQRTHNYYQAVRNRETIRESKISFCIKQLEKVKETTECILDNALKNSSLNQSYYDRLLDEIDNQINVLRNNKDGIH